MIKKRNLFFRKAVGLIAILFALPFLCAETLDTYCVEMSVTDISPSSIGIGEEFTIGVQIENCGSEIPEFVTLELINPPSDITIKEPLKIEISKIYYGNSERFITYHMRTNNDAIPGEHVIKTKLNYGYGGSLITKDSEISFEVIGEKAEIGIASTKILPTLPHEGETVELTLRVENVGEGDAKSLAVYLDHPFQGIKQSFIGKLASDEDGPAIFTFIANKSGEFECPVTISYYDDFGEKEFKSNIKLIILKKETNMGKILTLIFLTILILAGMFHHFKTKKAKDKIIHQLLRGDSSREKDKK